MKHQLTQTVHVYVTCGKCIHQWKESSRLVIYKCPKCKHEDIGVNLL
jgi:predicted RNA-binding Zn-ribbon protein involved in translation (DUF1610 family)